MAEKIVILHNRLSPDPTVDELDVMLQVNLINDELLSQGYSTKIMDIGDNLLLDLKAVEDEKPDLVFNLVETTFNKGELLYIVPGLLRMRHIPYTGVPVEGLFITTDKVLAKKQMRLLEIPTPEWFMLNEVENLEKGKRYLLKPISEDGSVGLHEEAVFFAGDPVLYEKVRKFSPSHYFLEEYIHGREFSVGLLTGENEPSVLPAGEIVFYNYEPDQPKILGYKAKWHPATPEYKNTVREFNTLNDPGLSQKLHDISVKCWKGFGFKGYGRVDFRIDEGGNPWVIEVNGNPCISPDSGYFAACKLSGISKDEVVKRILEDANF
jgi:D-alanine-D-alanine ligase